MKKILKALLIILIIIVVILAVIGIYVVNKLNKVNRVVIKPGEVQVTEGVEENLAEYRNIALFGIDTTGTYEGSRSDCIIIASINQKRKKLN